MTLTEFLLARIGVDERAAWAPYKDGCAQLGGSGVKCRYYDSTYVYDGTVEAITGMCEDHARATRKALER